MILRIFTLISPILFAVIVYCLGLITPGYDHLNHTISRLAIEQYGWVQSINFLQLAAGIYITGLSLTRLLANQPKEVAVIHAIFRLCSLLLLIAAIIPTDPIENVPLDYTLLTPTGLVHISAVILFLLLSPIGITKLAAVFRKSPQLSAYANLTLVAGFSALFGSVVWFVFYFVGIFLEYRGIFQKAIAIPVLLWLVILNNEIVKRKTAF